ncbi:GNAT family N-acetyltransferase [Congregibacter sp.]|uniref:GNAT family N-acetyltransferase n=1 Tax=Congregibacter sp. TaxID=2744308 RepID=UPI00385C3C8A
MIHFEITQDPALLDQYYALRERCFREELKVQDFDGSEQAEDRSGHILIARLGDSLVGGMRIAPACPHPAISAELAAKSDSICIWERLVCHPEKRSTQVSQNFLGHLIHHCRRLGYECAVVLSNLVRARYYRISHNALGIPFDILRPAPEFAAGAFSSMEHYLSVSSFGDRPGVREMSAVSIPLHANHTFSVGP